MFFFHLEQVHRIMALSVWKELQRSFSSIPIQCLEDFKTHPQGLCPKAKKNNSLIC